MNSIFRIIDANANRAREALRVMEEAARFLLDDAELSAAVKTARHDLAGALALLPAGVLEANRDTPGDIGRTIKTAREKSRNSAADVVLAAGKRLSEALRAMEEYGKTLAELPRGAKFAAQIERLRYRGYDLEQRLQRALAAGKPGRQWRLCVLLSQDLCPRGDWLAVARACIIRGGRGHKRGGADCLQLREKNLDAGELLVRARKLVALARPHGVSVIINDRPDVALLAGADGVHLGQSDLPCLEVRRLVGRQLLIGVSTSRLSEAQQAAQDGADYCGVGPMFPTTTKHKDLIVGPRYLRQYVAWGKLPHLAIGGINAGNVSTLTAAGARGVAVSSAACAAPDPARAVRAILKAMK